MRALCYIAVLMLAASAMAGTVYVSLSGSHESPYSSWATAATNFADAVNAATAGDTVLLTNGYYIMPGTAKLAPNGLHIKSVNGPSVTHIDRADAAGVFSFPGGKSNTIEGLAFTRCALRTDVVIYGVDGLANSLTLRNCVFSNNVSATYGSAISWYSIGQLLVENCAFLANENRNGTYSAGAVALWSVNNDASSHTLRNCLIVGSTNQCSTWDGGSAGLIATYYATNVLLENCTIMDNNSLSGYGGVGAFESANIRLLNCVVWNNAGTYGSNYNAAVSATYTLSGPQFSGDGNLSVDPELDGSYQPTAAAPVVNVGTNQSWMSGATDLEGNARIAYSIVDLGAYELRNTNVPPYVVGSKLGAFLLWRSVTP